MRNSKLVKSGPKGKVRADSAIPSRIVGHGEEDPTQLLAHPQNFRRHPGPQLEALRGSLQELGWVKGVLVNRTTGHVVDGHARVEEAIRQGQMSIPVDYVELSGAEELLALAVLDPISEMAARDEEALKMLLGEVVTEEPGLRAMLEEMGGKLAMESGLLAGVDEDAVPDPPEEPKTKLGDLYVLGDHRLLCGDATAIADVDRLMGKDTASLCWTDPPYGVSYVGKTKDALTIENDDKEGLGRLLMGAFAGIDRALMEGGGIYVAHPPGSRSVEFAVAFIGAGWRLHETLVWVKDSMVLGHSDYHYKHEPILYGYRPGGGRRGRGGEGWFGDNSQTSVLEFDRPKASLDHPTKKPVALVEYCIRNSCESGGLVYDPFGGSGTTLIACEKSGRACRMMELDPAYCDVIVRQWEEVTGKKAKLEGAGKRSRKQVTRGLR